MFFNAQRLHFGSHVDLILALLAVLGPLLAYLVEHVFLITVLSTAGLSHPQLLSHCGMALTSTET